MVRLIITLQIILMVMAVSFCHVAFSKERFTDNGDGTLTDNHRGLMWSKTDSGGDVDWKQAERWVRFTFSSSIPVSYENWRLPTIDELKSLYMRDEEYKGYNAECDQQVKIVGEIEISCGLIWSSDTFQGSIDTAQAFNFKRGIFYSDHKNRKHGYRALAVRDLK